jgi:hypothetical protein
MLTNEQQKELINLIIGGRLSPVKNLILQYEENLEENTYEYTYKDRYKKYLEENEPKCIFCGNVVSFDDDFAIRHLDCAVTDWISDCCRCSGKDCHKPEYTQFYCNHECYQNASYVRDKILNPRKGNEPPKEYYMCNTTCYYESSELMKKYAPDRIKS